MKISTLRLPTGEFALIVSGSTRPSAETLDGFRQFRRDIGAAGCLIVDQEVEIEDAIVDSDVVRREELVSLGTLSPDSFAMFGQTGDKIAEMNVGGDAHFHSVHIPRARLTPGEVQEIGDSTRMVSMTFTADPAVLELATGISPAGLVEGAPKTQAAEPEFSRGGEPGSDPTPDGVLASSDWDSSYEPKLNERVRIVTVNRHRGVENPHHGAIGRVIGFEKNYGADHEDCVVVRREGVSNAWEQGWEVYCVEVEPAPAEEPEQKPETD